MKGIGKILESGISSIGAGDAFNMGLNSYFTIKDVKDAKKDGYGTMGAIAKGVGTNLMYDVIGPEFMLYQAFVGLPKLGVQGYEKLAKGARSMTQFSANKPFQNSNFVDTPQAMTMRQAGMQLAKASKYNLQQTLLGNEASYMHL